MSTLSVSENIRIIEENMKKLSEQAISIQQELIRLEGSLRVFKNMSDLGIENIQLPKDEVTDTEVMDTLD
jgi:hypothetical protein